MTHATGPRNSLYKHGLTEHPLHLRWKAMLERCYYPHNKAYSHYGGRGIEVCAEWRHDFKAFYDWAIENGWDESLTLDRIDNDGNYCPENCRWISMKEQCRNRSNNVNITIDGVTKAEVCWCEEYGISRSAFRNRIRRGMSPKMALTVAVPLKETVEEYCRKHPEQEQDSNQIT